MNSSQNKPATLISLSHISYERENRVILSDVSIDVKSGDFIAITGPNGGGKTTLLRIMLKLLKPDDGSVVYHTLSQNDELRIGYLPQKNMIDSHFPISVSEVVASGLLGSKSVSRQDRDQKVEAMLDLVGMSQRANQAIGTLSGGQLQRTLLARAIISEPRLLVLDEPLSYIDKRFEQHFYEIIAELKRTTTIVLVSHEMTTLAEMANRHLIVDRTLHECTAHHHYIRSECE